MLSSWGSGSGATRRVEICWEYGFRYVCLWCDTNAGIIRTILRISHSQVMRRRRWRKKEWIKEKVNVDGLSAEEPHPERNAQ